MPGENMRKDTLIFGAVILLAANIFNRILGFLYQYLIMRYVGSEAYGLFHMVFPVYMTALVLTTAGLPIAVAKTVAEKVSTGRFSEAQKVFRVALLTLFLSGLFVSVVLYINIPFLVDRFFADKRIIGIFRICIPAVFFVSIASAFRGYFQGLQNMLPSAVSQVCEQILRVILGFTLAFKLLAKGVEWAAAGLAIGMLSGEILGLGVIILLYAVKKDKFARGTPSKESSGTILKNLLTLALPVTGSRLVSSGLSALETVIIPKQLQAAGYTSRSATSLFGQLSGTALTLLTFPSVFTFALATALIPAISEAMSKQNLKLAQRICSDAIRYTILIGLPCVIILYYYAQPLTLIFRSAEVAGVLQILALGGLFSYLQQTSTGILHGLGKTLLPLIHSMVCAFFRLPLLFYLTGLPAWGLAGSAVAYVFGFACVALLNLAAIKRHIKIVFDIKRQVVQPFTAGAGMLIVFQVISAFTAESLLNCFYSIIAGFITYLAVLFLNGGITTADIRKIPLLRRFF